MTDDLDVVSSGKEGVFFLKYRGPELVP